MPPSHNSGNIRYRRTVRFWVRKLNIPYERYTVRCKSYEPLLKSLIFFGFSDGGFFRVTSPTTSPSFLIFIHLMWHTTTCIHDAYFYISSFRPTSQRLSNENLSYQWYPRRTFHYCRLQSARLLQMTFVGRHPLQGPENFLVFPPTSPFPLLSSTFQSSLPFPLLAHLGSSGVPIDIENGSPSVVETRLLDSSPKRPTRRL